MLRVFIGRDSRQPIAYTVLADSIIQHASVPVSITALSLPAMPVKRRGLTEFSFSRFLVPYLCDYRGIALFLDADMVVTGDIKELFDCADAAYDLHVMQQQPKFEWASAMLFNCVRCQVLTPAYIDDSSNNPLDLTWAKSIGEIPAEWNRIVGYGPTQMPAKLLHFTRGLPIWPETAGEDVDNVWFDAMREAASTCSYEELMGRSVHNKARRAC